MYQTQKRVAIKIKKKNSIVSSEKAAFCTYSILIWYNRTSFCRLDVDHRRDDDASPMSS